MRWAYGVTTVPARKDTLLPKTLESLQRAGFVSPRLFVDGAADGYSSFGLDITYRYPTVRIAGNWFLSLAELYFRQPDAERFAIFQDDFVTYRNLREYLDRCSYPEKGYWNLYTFPANEQLANGRKGWYESNQRGLGAVALVFSRQAVIELLSNRYFIERPQDKKRGHKSIDGGIVTAFARIGWKEYVHYPSLVQHTGIESTAGNRQHPLSQSFLSEDYDAMELLC